MNLLFMNVVPSLPSFRRFRGAGEARPARHRRYYSTYGKGGSVKVPDFQLDTQQYLYLFHEQRPPRQRIYTTSMYEEDVEKVSP